MTHWAHSFYDVQEELTGCYSGPIHPLHRERAAQLREQYAGALLELGSGGGQFAVAAALAGFDVIALEYRAAGTAQALKLAREHGAALRALTGDFYRDDPGGPFHLIVYWDGFGIGTDEEQRHLLKRLPGWLVPGGRALIEVYMPYYWARNAGYVHRTPQYVQTYGFDAEGCRLTDTYAAGGHGQPQQYTQSLRCYTPADFQLLLLGTGLKLVEAKAGGQYDTETEIWHPQADWAECLAWVAVLEREEDQ